MKSACIGQPGTNSFDGELPQFSVPKVITLLSKSNQATKYKVNSIP